MDKIIATARVPKINFLTIAGGQEQNCVMKNFSCNINHPPFIID